MVLCNCIIEAESNFLLESIAACDPERDNGDFRDVFCGKHSISKLF